MSHLTSAVMALLDDIEAFLQTHEISATSLGHQALGDRHFVRQLRMGRRVWPETQAKVREFMERHASAHGLPDTASLEQSSQGKAGGNFPADSSADDGARDLGAAA